MPPLPAPHRTDIPVPPFPPGLPWVGAEPAAAERLTAKGPLLVVFFEAGELSGVQSLAHIDAWAQRYAEAGLTTIGVHTPRSDLARSPEAFAAAVERLGLSFPVVSDAGYHVWHAYGTKGWPSVFLWGLGGRLRWFHFGMGGLAETEDAIREQLRGGDSERALPEPVHETGAADQVEVEKPSDEVFPGGAHDKFWVGEPGEPLEVEYAGAGAWAALDGSGTAAVRVDEESAPTTFVVDSPGLYELADHGRHGVHEVRLDLDPGIRVWSVAFAAGPQ
jgi:hypothetical protein